VSAGRSHRRSQDHLLAGLEQALVSVASPNPLVVAWRWRYELILLLAVPLVLAALAHALGAWETAVTVAAGAAAAAAWPPARRALAARFWCVVTPHRVRVGCAQTRLHSRRGRLPFVLWTSPAPEGETVVLWCPAGATPRDFVSVREQMATACWATDVVVTPHPQRAHIVSLTVVRRQPARPSGVLAEGSGPWDPDTLALPPGLPPRGT